MDQGSVKTVREWLTKKNVTKCPACGHHELQPRGVVGVVMAVPMEIDDEPVLPGRHGAKTPPAKPVTPAKVVHALWTQGARAQPNYRTLVEVNCASCALALHFDAETIGLDTRE